MTGRHRLARSAIAAALIIGVGVAVLVTRSEGGDSSRDDVSDVADDDRPNILLFITDDQRASGTLGVMPATRRLFGTGGTRFRWAIATTPQCCPSRASIFSGQYAHNHGVMRNDLGERLMTEHTMQYELGRAGYQTAIVGKYLNGRFPNPPHFDQWASGYGRYVDPHYSVNGQGVTGRYSTSFLRATTLQFLDDFEEEDTKPWLLIVATWAPHRPARPAPRYRSAVVPPLRQTPAMSESDISDKPAYVQPQLDRDPIDVGTLRADQLRSLMSVDDLIEQTFAELVALDEEQSTLAFFVSDNGQTWGEHHIPASKQAPYDESVLIPFFVRWPGKVDEGAVVNNRIVATIDIAPTVYEAAGIKPSYAVDGRSVFISTRRVAFIEGWAGSDTFRVPEYRARWTPRSLYVNYKSQRDAREFYAPGDEWQLENVYKDDVKENEPGQQNHWDAWLARAARCSGRSCP
jgi:arylsulfatase A-like enzyme